MYLGKNSTHLFYNTALEPVGKCRCLKLVHKKTGAITYKVEHCLKTYKTIQGLVEHADKLRSEFNV